MNGQKKLVIIAGVTGAIGSALFAEYGRDPDTAVYGISRKALPVADFLRGNVLPLKTFICSLPVIADLATLFENIPYDQVSEIVYIHALGSYPFEVDKEGSIVVENDVDGDGINDEVTELTFNAFVSATQNLLQQWAGKSICVIFGGIADKHHPAVHQSWWKTMERVKEYMKGETKSTKQLSMHVFSISSVMCPHEVITRPFVFTDTDAEQAYWLHPYDLARFVTEEINKAQPGFLELEKFNVRPGFSPVNYYKDQNFTPRKVEELF